MSTEHLKRAEVVFEEALSRPIADRAEFVRNRCDGDPLLIDEVMSLLRHAGDSTAFLETPAADVPAAVESEPLPARIGSYVIRELIGAGGMGVVYLAEQENPRRTVALKVMQAGLRSRTMQRRFQVETSLLARLKHPGVAQIFEAGMHEGRPYFAMELVEGRTLIDFAQAEGLSNRERLTLLTQVCHAVQHAHQNGVIHRDLKPGNILVTDEGQVKVLDFGIARSNDPDLAATTLETSPGQLLGTLPYMSPEQLSGDPDEVDTRCDVYAMGVIGFELLTGRLPRDLTDLPLIEAIRVICEEAPAELSAIDRTLRGDLETIIATAITTEKDRRYQSISDLATDITRYLDDQPIVARPATTLYQLRKFAQRNRTLVGGAAVTFLVLLAGIVVTSLLLIRSLRAEARAEHEALKLSAVNQYYRSIFTPFTNRPNPEFVTLQELLDRTALNLDQTFPDEPELRASIQEALGAGYSAFPPTMPLAEQHLGEAMQTQSALLGERHPDTLSTMLSWSNLRERQGRLDEADAYIDRVYGAVMDGIEVDLRSVQLVRRLTEALNQHGRLIESETILRDWIERVGVTFGEEHAFVRQHQLDLAQTLTRSGRDPEVERICRRLVRATPSDGRLKPVHRRATQLLLRSFIFQEKYASVRPYIKQLLDLTPRQQVRPDWSPYPIVDGAAAMLQAHGAYEEAAWVYREALQRLSDLDPRVIGANERSLRRQLARTLHSAGHLDEAAQLFAELLEDDRPLHPADRLRAQVTGDLVGLEMDRDNVQEARRLTQRLADLTRVGNPISPRMLSATADYVRALRRIGETEAGLVELKEAIDRIDARPNADLLLQAELLELLGQLHFELEDFTAAREAAQRVVDMPDEPGILSPRLTTAKLLLGRCLTRLGDLDPAEPLLQTALHELRVERGERDQETQRALDALARLYHATGDDDAAQRYRDRIVRNLDDG